MNVDGSAAVAAAARGLPARHLSSDLVFDGSRGGYRETDEPAPVNSYGRSKAEAERRVAAAHPEATIVRTSLIYGGPAPGPQERLAREQPALLRRRDPLARPGRRPRRRAARAARALALAGPLHLGGADDVSRFDFAVLLGRRPGPARARAHDARPGAGRLARQLACGVAARDAPPRGLRGALGLAEPSARPRPGPRACAGSARAGRAAAPPCTRRTSRRRRRARRRRGAGGRVRRRARHGSGARC